MVTIEWAAALAGVEWPLPGSETVVAPPAGHPLTLADVWAALGAVPDPEVPVISIVELGIVRGVLLTHADDADGTARVALRLTTTYSGCPATAMIESLIRKGLNAIGVADLSITYQLAPAWTTDWMAPEARAKLAAFGIAPPSGRAAVINVTGISPLRRADVVVPCPRCGSHTTSLLAQFGSTACKAQYRCNACREPFDYFKPH